MESRSFKCIWKQLITTLYEQHWLTFIKNLFQFGYYQNLLLPTDMPFLRLSRGGILACVPTASFTQVTGTEGHLRNARCLFFLSSCCHSFSKLLYYPLQDRSLDRVPLFWVALLVAFIFQPNGKAT